MNNSNPIFHRLTNDIRFAAKAARATQNHSRRTKVRLCVVLSTPHLGQGTFASQSPITCPKRRISETLCEKEAGKK